MDLSNFSIQREKGKNLDNWFKGIGGAVKKTGTGLSNTLKDIISNRQEQNARQKQIDADNMFDVAIPGEKEMERQEQYSEQMEQQQIAELMAQGYSREDAEQEVWNGEF